MESSLEERASCDCNSTMNSLNFLCLGDTKAYQKASIEGTPTLMWGGRPVNI
jgi:hypothetical protein